MLKHGARMVERFCNTISDFFSSFSFPSSSSSFFKERMRLNESLGQDRFQVPALSLTSCMTQSSQFTSPGLNYLSVKWVVVRVTYNNVDQGRGTAPVTTQCLIHGTYHYNELLRIFQSPKPLGDFQGRPEDTERARETSGGLSRQLPPCIWFAWTLTARSGFSISELPFTVIISESPVLSLSSLP